MRVSSYRERLVLEGSVLAGSGVAGSIVLLLLADGATDGPWNTVGQLVVVAGLCAWLGPRFVRRWMAAAESTEAGEVSGDPTPLWQLPAITAGLTLLVALPTGMWDAGLRVTGGCALVGLMQAALLAPLVAHEERRSARRFVRLPGSRIGRGTRLGWLAYPRSSASPTK
jgi:hypothetical protein